jgi:hypothetical protein
MGDDGAPRWLFRPAGEPSRAAKRYIEEGVLTGVADAYKARVRSPWWRVPYLEPADLFLTYMNAGAPRISANRAGVHHLNSVHGMYLVPQLRELGMSLLPLASLNSLTLLDTELVGRSYGGGLLKVEPREADRLRMPSPELLASLRLELTGIRGKVALRLAQGRLSEASALVDEVILERGLGFGVAAIREIREAREHLVLRRMTRGRSRGR